MSADTIEMAKLALVIAFWVAILVVSPVAYWLGKRRERMKSLDRQPVVDHTQGKAYC